MHRLSSSIFIMAFSRASLVLVIILLASTHDLLIDAAHQEMVASLVDQSSGNKTIDCGSECGRRCGLSSRPNLCNRACGTCCARCGCVPPGTYGNREVCPCYARMTTHGGRPKCP